MNRCLLLLTFFVQALFLTASDNRIQTAYEAVLSSQLILSTYAHIGWSDSDQMCVPERVALLRILEEIFKKQ